MSGFLQILGAIADFLGVTGFIAGLFHGSAIKKIKNRIVNEQLVIQFNKERKEIAEQIQLYIDLLTSKQFSDRLSFNMRLTTLLSQIECYKDVILDGNFKKNLKNTLNAKRKEDDEKIIYGLVKIKKVFERSLKKSYE